MPRLCDGLLRQEPELQPSTLLFSQVSFSKSSLSHKAPEPVMLSHSPFET